MEATTTWEVTKEGVEAREVVVATTGMDFKAAKLVYLRGLISQLVAVIHPL